MSKSMRVAEFIDSKITETAEELARNKRAQMYTVKELDGSFVPRLAGESPDPYDLLRQAPNGSMADVTSLCLVMTGWMSRINDEDEDEDADPIRERVRIISAVSDDGVAVVVRKYTKDGEHVDSFSDGGEGAFPEALKAYWQLCSVPQGSAT